MSTHCRTGTRGNTWSTRSPGALTAIVPAPTVTSGFASGKHGDDLPVFCKQTTLKDAPDSQSIDVDVKVPALIKDS